LSAHVLVDPDHDCHEVSSRLRALLAESYGIGHVTLQADHADSPTHDAQHCVDAHGIIHTAPAPHG
jgi:cobalt-zinc-cadmium efflux system protein